MASHKVEILEITPEELASGTLSSPRLEKAILGLHRDGIIVLTGAIDLKEVETLRVKMVQDAEQVLSRKNIHFNFGVKNIQQEPPVSPEYVFEGILANRLVSHITSSILGPDPQVRLYSANTLFETDSRQPVHIDIDFDTPPFPFLYLVNTYLTAVSAHNGATEIWPGTHLLPSHREKAKENGIESGPVDKDLLEERRAVSPPCQLDLPQGSIIIRDVRLWHAGMPSYSSNPRTMIVTAQVPAWYRNKMSVLFPPASEKKIQSFKSKAQVAALYTAEAEGDDPLRNTHNIDFRQDTEWAPKLAVN